MSTTAVVLISSLIFNHVQQTLSSTASCVGRCSQEYSRSFPCQCNSLCARYNNCCNDYIQACQTVTADSCVRKCGLVYDKTLPCQCNTLCSKYANCCDDYSSVCLGTIPSSAPLTTTIEMTTTTTTRPTTTTTTTAATTSTTRPTTTTTIPTSTQPSKPLIVSNYEISQIISDLWKSDVNAAIEGRDYSLNLQGRISDITAHRDRASLRLFSLTDESSMFSRPTYSKFLSLLDNYNMNTGVSDYPSSLENTEVTNFLREVVTTPVMQKAWAFLRNRGYAPSSEDLFVKQLRELWFSLYSRAKGRQDSSGFEHVFVGEIKDGKVSGSHSWINFYISEKLGKVNYKGYLRQRQPNLLVSQFTLSDAWKDEGSMLLGPSPEFELAVYTLCFLVRPNDACQTKINGSSLKIVTYDVDYLSDKNRVVATAFPVG